jgi:formylglycine-generating enzyme required for sulfatase activity
MNSTRDVRLVTGPDSSTDPPPYYAQSWALVIGIDRYQDASARLANARNDAAAVADLLTDVYHFEHVHTLYDEQVTKDALLTWLRDRLPAQVQRDDRLIIFFAGHGTTREGATREGGSGQTRGYLIPYDAEFGRFADYVDMAELRDACGWIPAKHILIILDCCFSGIAAVTARSTVAPNANAKLTDHYLQRITERGAWQVLTAGALDELVADSGSRPGHSAFTSALLAGLEGAADQNRDSVITASDLAAYVKPEVSRETTLSGGKGQIPFFSYLAGSDQGDFVLIKPGETPRLVSTPLPTPPVLRANPIWFWGGLALVIGVVALMSWFVWSSQRETRVAQAALASIIGTMTWEAATFEVQQQATLDAVTSAPQPTIESIRATHTAAAVGTREAVAPVLTAVNEGSSFPHGVTPPTVIPTPSATATEPAISAQVQQPAAQVVTTPDSQLAPQSQIGQLASVALTNPKDCTTVVQVPAGQFKMGPELFVQSGGDEHVVAVEEFWIGRTEVTFGQYAACVADGQCKAPLNERLNDPNYANYPVTNVTWRNADEYARWAGGRLPTEAEWEFTACGNDDRVYPWGSTPPDETRLNFSATGVNDIMPVGSLPDGASPFGALDMAGNVWEWTSSLYLPYPYVADDGREDSNAAGDRVLRGGAFDSDEGSVLCTMRLPVNPDNENAHAGFRIVFDDASALSDDVAQCGGD